MKPYIIDRIRRDFVKGNNIVENSTPIVFFGNINTAKVATLGLNPSKNEFSNKKGELTEDQRRFETLNSLNIKLLSELDDLGVEKIYSRCINYFNNDTHYKKWFDQLQRHILNRIEVSYYNGSACHLDIVQWATDPVWGKVSNKAIKQQLIGADINFLRELLLLEKIETLLINGKENSEIFFRHFKPFFVESKNLGIKNGEVSLHRLLIDEKELRVFAWNKNLQSARYVTNQVKDEIGLWIQSK